jgi:hypothetical protein
MNQLRLTLTALGALLLLSLPAQAQFQIKGGSFNSLRVAGPPVDLDGTPPVVTPQFAGAASTAASSGPVSDSSEHNDRYPAGEQTVDITVTSAIVLIRSSFGGTFASGVPRYSLGDEIQPPEFAFDNATPAGPSYWRARPVAKDEVITQPNATQVTPVTGPDDTYYYSPHANKVFAHRPGRVTITWMTLTPEEGEFRFKTEIFDVSSGTNFPVRTIYWTERGFRSPAINIPTGQIVTVNPVYSTFFPSTVATEYQGVGYVAPEPGAAAPPELRTLWFENTAGLGQLRAFNREGRIFVEYLGALSGADQSVHEFLGADIVEVKQVITPSIVTVDLGEQILPHKTSTEVADDPDFLLPSSVLNLGQDGITYYGTSARPDGQLIYHAEWENNVPDKVAFYWLERNDAGVHFVDPPESPNLEIAWPKYLNKYLQVWPESIADYAGVTVEDNGSTADTGVQFNGGNIPEVVFQDDGAQSEVSIELNSQRLVADLSASYDKTNRSLLKFSNGSGVWYQRLFIQSQSVLGSPEVAEVPDPDGTGPLEGTPFVPAVVTLADLDADGLRDLSADDLDNAVETNVVVGQRIERPDDSYELAGFIAEGDSYLPDAYQDPFITGVEAAGAGAIIPVNAIPGSNEFTVWWFKEVSAPDASFEPFYVPSKSGRYTVSWPATSTPTGPTQDQIILASNAGSGDLASAEAAGEIYVQNESTLPGFNPNDEHALMLVGRAYAMRDDLNVTTPGDDYTSEPFVLVFYTDPADARPAVRTFEVLREIDLNDDDIEDSGDILFNYPVTAGATVPSPMPMPLLPLPVRPDGSVPNVEVDGIPDPALDRSGPVALYDEFTYQDRKGFTKVYRGPHDGGTPTMGMQFYYTMRNGFFIPGLDPQPEEGTVLPYLRPDGVTGTLDLNAEPLTVIYRPVWPDAVPELRIGETLALPKFGLPQVRGQSSALVLYEQSIALEGTTKPSVTLHDPTRAKTMLLSSQELTEIPTSIATTIYQGRTYFQRLAPHLQQRVYVTGSDPQLFLLGEFVDEIAGEDYFDLNVLSVDDIAALKGLVDASDDDKTAWEDAIDALSTTVETFIENPAQAGSYIVGSSTDVDGISLTVITDSDTAVVDYALTATGDAAGYVSLIFGNGENPDQQAQGDPVSIAIVKVVPKLYVGDMKVQFSSNPLDEQVSLRHSGDFAARPQDYEFEWRYSPGGISPEIYENGLPVQVLDNATTWTLVQNPSTTAESTTSDVSVPRSLTIYDADHDGGDLPGVLMKSDTDFNFSGNPSRIIFSADLSSSLDGFVLYVNGNAALASRAPDPFENTDAVSGLSAFGLPSQFEINSNYFTQGLNTIEVALYSSADPLFTTSVNFRLETVTKEDRVDPLVYAASPWLQPNGTLLNQITIGGSPTAPLGDPLLLMQDNSFTVRYRPLLGSGGLLTENKATQDDVAWSEWMEPKVIPGWIKRVLNAINPFNQRMTDLYNNAVNTDVSVLTQAGSRWEGDIALNLDNVNDAGLIEIYETVLNRAKLFTIDNGYDTPGTNDALLLAAGYLNDLYVILGNEAYADAANPTISLDDQDTVTEVSSSRFSFEGQVATVLDEELALLRGRDDFLSTSVATAPAYNRLYWNYTKGIDSGEVLYAVNYNIKEKAGSDTADGVINAEDAARMFPQSHGDAYGHYLTALSGYYKLLTNDNFTWTPRTETQKVLGQDIEVDYFDERKFARAAADLSRTAEQILSLTYRQSYQDDKSEGWSHFRDDKPNAVSGINRQWGVDEWASRSTQGAYFHWVNGNAMLIDEDIDPDHTGIRKVDRSTVPELALVAATAESFQTTMDNANAFLNPLGLSPDAIAFDISPASLKAGDSHFEQIYDRALAAVLNAKGSFDQAGRMTRLLRNQENQIDDFNTALEEEERAFNYQLIDLYGSPYPGDVGAGKTYPQGYEGPDLTNWFVVDSPTDLVDTSEPLSVEVRVPVNIRDFEGFNIMEINASATDGQDTTTRTVNLSPIPFAQFSTDWFLGMNPGQRAVTGRMQQALTDAQLAYMAVTEAGNNLENDYEAFERKTQLMLELITYHQDVIDARDESLATQRKLTAAKISLQIISAIAKNAAKKATETADAVAEAPPTVVGLASDATSSIRSAIKVIGKVIATVVRLAAVNADKAALLMESLKETDLYNLTRNVEELGFSFEQKQAAYEFELQYQALLDRYIEIAQLSLKLQKATEEVRNLNALGDRIQLEREIFRQRAATIVQGYRTNDVAFRTFRNEALEQYRTLFDLASRYTYLAAKSYDYETGLLGTTQGQEVFDSIVGSRALGDLTGGVPQSTTSTLGDAGLAGTMAQLVADFSVAEGRLGINNPDQNGTLFSLRHELFRLLDNPNVNADDEAWKQTLEQHIVSDLMADPDAATYCLNLRKADGSRVPGIIIPFTTTIQQGYNWFGLPLAGGDHNFSAASFATKIYAAGAVLEGYVGMDQFATGTLNAGDLDNQDPDALAATPYIYLIPVGTDYMRAPALGDTGEIRAWDVADQALPLPYNLGATDFNSNQFFNANGTLSEQPWILRKHQPFRPVDDPAYFYGLIPQEFTSSRLVGRSAWNGQWKIVIPAYSLLNDEEEGLERFVRSVEDIKIFLRTYSNSGN